MRKLNIITSDTLPRHLRKKSRPVVDSFNTKVNSLDRKADRLDGHRDCEAVREVLQTDTQEIV